MNDLMACCQLIETPIGMMTLFYEERPFLLTAVRFPSETKKALNGEHFIKTPGNRHPIRQVESLLKKYFRGSPIHTPWDFICLDSFTYLQQAVLRQTAGIPFGSVASYREIALAVGRPKAYRFVGATLARNPYPVLIPCHRVIRSDKGMGGFGGGINLKKRLIDFESRQ
jgi:methylated-DNA-[protein]-cysteine S-methyltransferase